MMTRSKLIRAQMAAFGIYVAPARLAELARIEAASAALVILTAVEVAAIDAELEAFAARDIEPAPVMLTIKGTGYAAESLPGGAVQVTKLPGCRVIYEVHRNADGIVECTCPHYQERLKGLAWNPCKHGAAVVAAGFELPRIAAAPMATPVRKPEPEPADADPILPCSACFETGPACLCDSLIPKRPPAKAVDVLAAAAAHRATKGDRDARIRRALARCVGRYRALYAATSGSGRAAQIGRRALALNRALAAEGAWVDPGEDLALRERVLADRLGALEAARQSRAREQAEALTRAARAAQAAYAERPFDLLAEHADRPRARGLNVMSFAGGQTYLW